jgi:hypothetical protein
MRLTTYLTVGFWVFGLSFLGQAFGPRETAAASVWGFAPGWQREIGFFDLAMALLTFSAIRSNDLAFQRNLAQTIVVLTLLVGTNHLATILSGETSLLHEVFVVVNYAFVVFGFAAILSNRVSADADGVAFKSGH